MIGLLLKTMPSTGHAIGRRRRAAQAISRLRSAEPQPRQLVKPRELTVSDRLEIDALLTAQSNLAEHGATKAQQALHQATNVQITAAGPDAATATAVLIVHALKDGRRSTYVDFVGEVRDEFVRTPAGWRISSRRLVHLADA
jgi:3-phenylpropionate/cinnamic acid dioxygenase small subunit